MNFWRWLPVVAFVESLLIEVLCSVTVEKVYTSEVKLFPSVVDELSDTIKLSNNKNMKTNLKFNDFHVTSKQFHYPKLIIDKIYLHLFFFNVLNFLENQMAVIGV